MSEDPEQLAARYGALATVVRRGGRAYPAAYAALTALEVVVGSDPLVVDDELAAGGAAHLAAVRARVPWMYDGTVIALDRLAGAVLHVAPSGFFARIATGDALRAEAGDALRTRAEALAGGDPLRSGRGRAAGIGVTVLATLPLGDGRAVVLGRRAGLPIGHGTWHVVPAGMAEPHDGVVDPFVATAVEELQEELGVECPPADLRLLGLGWDLLRLVPELIYRVDLDADAEAVLAAAPREEHDALVLHAIDSHGRVPSVWSTYAPLQLAAPGAAALALLEDCGP
jgi:8-oxo-dGTP pyrophosphatase MutT (NUDIX family)